MKRVITSILAAGAFAVIGPAPAVAHGHGRHGNHHKAHVSFETFGPSGSSTSAPSSTTTGVPTANAGTIQSFKNGVLVISLNDGSTVSGAVGSDTEIECASTTPVVTGDQGPAGSRDGGDDDSAGEDNRSGTTTTGTTTTDSQRGEDANDGEGADDGEGGHCTTADLIPGATVHEAQLRVGSTGAVWQKVELVK